MDKRLKKLIEKLDEAVTYRRYKEVLKMVKEGFELSEKLSSIDTYHYFLGVFYVINGDLEGGLLNFLKAIYNNPSFVEAYNELANVFNELGLDRIAIFFIDQAIKINPNKAQLYNNKGWYLLHERKYKEALNEFKKATALSPEFLVTYINIADTLLEMGKKEEAKKTYYFALDLAIKKEEIVCIKYINDRLARLKSQEI